MHVQMLVYRDVRRLEHAGPVDAVWLQNVLRRDVLAHRPVRIESLAVGPPEDGDVIDERVEPDVRHVALVERQRDTPRQYVFRTADRQVSERTLQEREHLVAIALRSDGFRVVVQVADEPVLVRAHPEEVVVLRGELRRDVVVGAFAVHQFVLVEEPFAAGTVEALVRVVVDLALVVHPLEDGAHHVRVALFGRTDEIVVLDVHRRPERAELLRDAVGPLLRFDASLARRLVVLRAVLVGAGGEIRVLPFKFGEARQRIGNDRRVRVSEVWRPVYVVDRRCDVEAFH